MSTSTEGEHIYLELRPGPRLPEGATGSNTIEVTVSELAARRNRSAEALGWPGRGRASPSPARNTGSHQSILASKDKDLSKKTIPSLPARRPPTPPPLPSMQPELAAATSTSISAESTTTGGLKRNLSLFSCMSLENRRQIIRRTTVFSEKETDNTYDLESSQYKSPRAENGKARDRLPKPNHIYEDLNEFEYSKDITYNTLQSPANGAQMPQPHPAFPPPLPSKNGRGAAIRARSQSIPDLTSTFNTPFALVNFEENEQQVVAGVGREMKPYLRPLPPTPLTPPTPPPLPAKSVPLTQVAERALNSARPPLPSSPVPFSYSPPTQFPPPPPRPIAPPIPPFAPPLSPPPFASVFAAPQPLSSHVPDASLKTRHTVQSPPAVASVSAAAIQTSSAPPPPPLPPPPFPPSSRSSARYNGAGSNGCAGSNQEAGGLHEASIESSPPPLPEKHRRVQYAPPSHNAVLSQNHQEDTTSTGTSRDAPSLPAASCSSSPAASKMTREVAAEAVSIPCAADSVLQLQQQRETSATNGVSMSISAPLQYGPPISTVLPVVPLPRLQKPLTNATSFMMCTFARRAGSTHTPRICTANFTSTAAVPAKNPSECNAAPPPIPTSPIGNTIVSSTLCLVRNTDCTTHVNGQVTALRSERFQVVTPLDGVLSASSRSPSPNSNCSSPSHGPRLETETSTTTCLSPTSTTSSPSSVRSAQWKGRWEERFVWHEVHELSSCTPRILHKQKLHSAAAQMEQQVGKSDRVDSIASAARGMPEITKLI